MRLTSMPQTDDAPPPSVWARMPIRARVLDSLARLLRVTVWLEGDEMGQRIRREPRTWAAEEMAQRRCAAMKVLSDRNQSDYVPHMSDCAACSEPMEPAGPCDCGAALSTAIRDGIRVRRKSSALSYPPVYSR